MRSLVRFIRDNIRATLVIVVVIVLLLLMIGGVFLWEKFTDQAATPSNGGSSSSLQTGAVEYIGGVAYKQKETIDTVLFIGVDKYESETSSSYINNQQADFVTLLVLDHDEKAYTLLQFNRDTMTQIETIGVMGNDAGTITAQLALSHAYGTGGTDSSRNVTKAVSYLLYGVDIEHYATLKLDAVSILNDAVGGVKVELLADFTSLDPSFTEGATVTLHGEQATAYIRARGSLEDSTNISRMERQAQYMDAWLDTFDAKYAEDDSLIVSITTAVSDYLVTDLSNEQMEDLAVYYETYTSRGLLSIDGESVKGEEYMEFHVNEAALREQVLDLFYIPAE